MAPPAACLPPSHGTRIWCAIWSPVVPIFLLPKFLGKDGEITFFKHDVTHPNSFVDVSVSDIPAIRKSTLR